MPHRALPLATPLLDLPSVFDISPISTPGDTPPNLHVKRTHSLLENHPSFVAALHRNQHLLSHVLIPLDRSRSLPPGQSGLGNTLLSRRSACAKRTTLHLTDSVDCVPLLDSPTTLVGSHLHSRTHDNAQLPHATKMQMADYLRKFEHLFMVTPQRMRMIVEAFIDTLEAGLKEDGQCVPMIPTFVFGWPTGKEVGPYLAVDLGGTNLRVCHVELQGDGRFEITQAKYKLTDEQKQQEGEKLFDFCAECLSKFVNDQYVDDDGNLLLDADIPLGFTFSYPCTQKKIDHGELIRWTKGFGNPNVEGHDVGEIFSKSLKKFNVPVKLTAVINDTTGTLIASSYVDPATRIGVIFGTGCNAAYMEKVANIPKIASLGLPPDAEMAINCEWGAFDSGTHEHLPRTKYDLVIDETSNKPGEQAFEKMIAGLYLGEVFRLIVVEMIEEGILFLGQNTYKMEKSYCFDTAFLSLIESDPTEELLTVTGLFTHFFGLDTTISERQFFRRLAELIGTRSARLSACGIAAIVSKMGMVETGCGVATDGSLYNKYPQFPQRLHEALVDIFGEKGRLIKTYHAEDGSGVGSAIIAAMTKARLAEGKFTHV
ncbi:hexokinase A, variant 2 [Puccinia graminis f. sp. tritici]|uniref:Phosphotransferase n=2 Tax=Puccinia graminis f. sp. tritici TaxID=56615 RepID=A0A5B0LSK4_PUCGR|nr:hexokinase A, variant 2 [Puccinia graminis f. sp. tritici]